MADDTGEIGREAAESVGFEDIKSAALADKAASYYQTAGYAEHLANTQAMNTIRVAAVTRGVDTVMGSPVDRVIDVALGQIAGKNAGNTPPVTP